MGVQIPGSSCLGVFFGGGGDFLDCFFFFFGFGGHWETRSLAFSILWLAVVCVGVLGI